MMTPSLSRRSLLALGAAALAGLSLPRAARTQTPLRIVATTGMIADAARAISGGGVQGLMGPGVDPHGYRQTRSDIAALVSADLVLWHGLRLEAQLAGLMETLQARGPVVAVAETVDPARLLRSPDYPDQPDPHLWMDPDLWLQVVAAIADAITGATTGADPEPAETLPANAAAYRAEITAVQDYAKCVLASVPPAARVLVTAHDAFGYFGRAYGFEVEGLQGISTESEAGLARIRDLVDLLVERDIRAVFVESSVPDRAMRALIEGAAARGHTVVIGGELYSDAMGPEGSHEGTYPGMIDHNVTTIARALGGSAPERGAFGKLAAGT
ncbi:metal ABC transporter solute-binding protein, Zn/Mn family [Szabonella alba]|uniref:Zinc ABC transporter substrate-binding protein n=1 Tax=Szabonella alba TaxID=2804194 RepID=A0A8K0Y1R6_9RHOB|nr:zinc ABC transporter substrate-binding protein [Szabonella alba]MBL4916324.1 zinc ABC transporter substrate-binding protein [Szabonella alba]